MLKFLVASASLYSAQAITTCNWGGSAYTAAFSVTDPIGSSTFDTIANVAAADATTTYVGLFLGSSPTPTSHTEQVTGGPVTKIACTSTTTSDCDLPLYQNGDVYNPVSAGTYTMYEVDGTDADYASSLNGIAGIVVTVDPYISAWGSTLNQAKGFVNIVERGDEILVTWDGLNAGDAIQLKVEGTDVTTFLTECQVTTYEITADDVSDGKTRGTASLKTSSSGEHAKFAIPANYLITMYDTYVATTCTTSTTQLGLAREVQIQESDTLTLTYSGTTTSGSTALSGVEAGTKVDVNYNIHAAATTGTYVGLFAAHASDYSLAPSSHTVDATGGTAGAPLAASFLPVGISGSGSIELEVPLNAPLLTDGYIVYMLNTNDADFSPLTTGSYGTHGKYGPTFDTVGVTTLPATNSDLDIVESPTSDPTGQPSGEPSGEPTLTPTSPTGQPTGIPTSSPSFVEEPWGEYVWTEKRHRKAGMCENQCSGHGTCEVNGNCKCFTGLDGEDEWTGPDCSSRTCPFDFAWVGASINSNNLHPWAECSNKGICDRASGECQCFTGYEGAACQRTVCPDNCNDQGTCWPEKHLASKAGRVYEAPWDAMKHVGCLCDAGYRGPACDQQECPSGADPLSGYGNEAGRDCSGRGICDYSNGICACFTGFFGTRCQHQTTVM
jgi:hypothetical protein